MAKMGKPVAKKTVTKKRGVNDITPERRAQLNAGVAACTDLVESLVVDFATLMHAAVPEIGIEAVRVMDEAAGSGITQRMALAGRLLHERLGEAGFERLRTHASDTVRGWVCYMLAEMPGLTLEERLSRVRPLADDPHYGPREWAWIALRPLMAAELPAALMLLQPWTGEDSERLRRFASESLRPRGVWCSHIAALKKEPALCLPLLEPLRADASVYVQNSVANWLNDASKDQPDWVRNVCARWLNGEPDTATRRICKRALRTIGV